MRRFPLPHGLLAIAALLLPTGPGALAGPIEAWGFRAGLSASHLSGDFGEPYGGDFRAGFAGSAFWRFGLARDLSFESEVAWVAKGGDGNPDGVTTPGPSPQTIEIHLKTQVQYLEFPLLLRYVLPTPGSVRPHLVAGPAPAVKLGVQQDIDVSVIPAPGTDPQLQYAFIYEQVGTLGGQRVEPFELGLVGGAGVELGSGRRRVLVEGRYTHGLIDTIEGGVESRNGSFTVTLGLEFH